MNHLSPELLAEWREASATCEAPISLDRKIVELVDLVVDLRAQRDDLQGRNTELVGQRRAAWAEVAVLRAAVASGARPSAHFLVGDNGAVEHLLAGPAKCFRCGDAEVPGYLLLSGKGNALIPCPYCQPGKAVEWMADAAQPYDEAKDAGAKELL